MCGCVCYRVTGDFSRANTSSNHAYMYIDTHYIDTHYVFCEERVSIMYLHYDTCLLGVWDSKVVCKYLIQHVCSRRGR